MLQRARSDGIVQAIEASAGPIQLGVQWHPEYRSERPRTGAFARHWQMLRVVCRTFRLTAAG